MSATNHTSTIELSQYISTDKPTYLTDYNGDMLKIDNAIAADRDSISTAQNKADTADGKADANKTSIDTLNEQINGDPSATPPTTGIAGKVTTLENSVNTLSSLVGNGHPTTSDQTLIGAVNGLEASLAPREDGADLANSYAEGEQFARGGSVYTALTSLTADTAFASLTLNTDYKNSDTLVEQIADVKGNIPVLPSGYLITTEHIDPEVTADGVKTYRELLTDLFALIDTEMASAEYDAFILAWISVGGVFGTNVNGLRPYGRSATTAFELITSDSTSVTTAHIDFRSANSNYREVVMTTAGNTFTDKTSEVPTSGVKIGVRMYKCVPQNIT